MWNFTFSDYFLTSCLDHCTDYEIKLLLWNQDVYTK